MPARHLTDKAAWPIDSADEALIELARRWGPSDYRPQK